jgi:hypothetical protein
MIPLADEKAALAHLQRIRSAMTANDPVGVMFATRDANAFYRQLIPVASDPIELEALRFGFEAIAYAVLWAVERIDVPS